MGPKAPLARLHCWVADAAAAAATGYRHGKGTGASTDLDKVFAETRATSVDTLIDFAREAA